MRFGTSRRTALGAALVAGALTLTACSAGSLGESGGGDAGGRTEIAFLTNNDPEQRQDRGDGHQGLRSCQP